MTDNEVKAEVNRLLTEKLKLPPGLLRDAMRQLQYQADNQFSEVIVSDGVPPAPAPMPDRYDIYKAACDPIIEAALRHYE
jgi:hypothetical protein